mgnify:CR=1 FL=1
MSNRVTARQCTRLSDNRTIITTQTKKISEFPKYPEEKKKKKKKKKKNNKARKKNIQVRKYLRSKNKVQK